MVIEYVENSLRVFEKKFYLKKWTHIGIGSQLPNPVLRPDFSKSNFSALFLQYNLTDVSYDPDVFTGAKS